MKVFIDPAFNKFAGPAYAALEQLLEIAGWQSQRVADKERADICYSPNREVNNLLPCAGVDAWSKLRASTPCKVNGLIVPSAALVDGRGDAFDWVLTAHFFLAGLPEQEKAVRQGLVPGKAIDKWGLLERPTVQIVADMLRDRLCRGDSIAPPRPKWPGGKRWCLCLTHDCDKVYRFRPHDFYMDSLAMMRRGKLPGAALAALKCLYAAVAYAATKEDPYLASWRIWLQLEQELGIRAAYYVGTWNRYAPDASPADLHYNCRDDGIRTMVGQIANAGSEVGLHSSIGAWRFRRFDRETDRFEQEFGFRPIGFRAHYLSLDVDNPVASFALASQTAGLHYDTSLGLVETHGFRMGTAYPYRPFDPVTGDYAGLWELPLIMMDNCLHQQSGHIDECRRDFRSRAESVSRSGGCLVLDWHSHVLAEASHIQPLTAQLIRFIQTLTEEAVCWVATPRQVFEWCSDDRWNSPKH